MPSSLSLRSARTVRRVDNDIDPFATDPFRRSVHPYQQGKPPLKVSTGWTVFQSMVVMSPRLGALGQWRAKTWTTGSVVWANQVVGVSEACLAARASSPEAEDSDPAPR